MHDDGTKPVSLNDECWIKNGESPALNGWYDIAVERSKKIAGEAVIVHELALGLFRDGTWRGEFHGKFLAWRNPRKLRDDIEFSANDMNMDGVINFATSLIEAYRNDFKVTYRELITASRSQNYHEKIQNYLYSNRLIGGQIILTAAGGLSHKDIVVTLCNQELKQCGIKLNYLEATRKAIHNVIKDYLERKAENPRISSSALSNLNEWAFAKIRGVMQRGRCQLPPRYRGAETEVIVKYLLDGK